MEGIFDTDESPRKATGIIELIEAAQANIEDFSKKLAKIRKELALSLEENVKKRRRFEEWEKNLEEREKLLRDRGPSQSKRQNMVVFEDFTWKDLGKSKVRVGTKDEYTVMSIDEVIAILSKKDKEFAAKTGKEARPGCYYRKVLTAACGRGKSAVKDLDTDITPHENADILMRAYNALCKKKDKT